MDSLEDINKRIFYLNIDLKTGQKEVNKVLTQLASLETLFSTPKLSNFTNLLKSISGQLEKIG